jgi:hypothetical protein
VVLYSLPSCGGGRMNPIFDIVFTVTWIGALIYAIRMIADSSNSKSVRDYNTGTWTTQVTKRVHPEMEGVEPGTELMGVNFDKKISCDLEEYKDLQARIDELREELEGDDEDEDDDGGDIVALRR